MSDEKEFGFTNVGTDGVMPVPVESKEPTLETEIKNETTPVVVEEKKKRGRPSKKTKISELLYYCATCRERFSDLTVSKMPMEFTKDCKRYSLFCPNCTKSLGIIDSVMQETVQDLIKNNPTGK